MIKGFIKHFTKKIESLKKKPIPDDKKHILDFNRGRFLCEFSIQNYRFYYEVLNGEIIINQVLYLGKVDINYAKKHKSGSFGKWNRQRDFINWIKKKFKKN